MANLIKELVEDFKKAEKKLDKKVEKMNKASKIAANVDENGCVEVLAVSGSQPVLLSIICLILQEMARHSDDSAEHMAMIVLSALKVRKEMRKENND